MSKVFKREDDEDYQNWDDDDEALDEELYENDELDEDELDEDEW
jgi:hypothetical protein